MSGLARQFWLMKEKSRCSILFHLLVPGGRWQTMMSRPSSLASFWSSRFHSRTREPLLPPPPAFAGAGLAVISSRVALRAIFAAIVTEIPDQFFFLGVDRDYRLLFRQSCGYLGVDAAKLRIPVGVAVALLGLAVGLQAVARRIEQFGHHGAAHLVAVRLQCLRQPAHALAGPPQRRSRIPACRWFDQRLEIWE